MPMVVKSTNEQSLSILRGAESVKTLFLEDLVEYWVVQREKTTKPKQLYLKSNSNCNFKESKGQIRESLRNQIKDPCNVFVNAVDRRNMSIIEKRPIEAIETRETVNEIIIQNTCNYFLQITTIVDTKTTQIIISNSQNSITLPLTHNIHLLMLINLINTNTINAHHTKKREKVITPRDTHVPLLLYHHLLIISKRVIIIMIIIMMTIIIAVMMTSSQEILDSIKSNSIIIIIQVMLLTIDINNNNINLLLLHHLEDNNNSKNKNLKGMYFIMIIIIMGHNMR